MLNCDGLVCIADSLIDCVSIILGERLPEISKARFHLTHLLCKRLKGNLHLRNHFLSDLDCASSTDCLARCGADAGSPSTFCRRRFHLTHLLCKRLKGNLRLRRNGQGNQYLKHNPSQIRSDSEDVCWPRKISVFHGAPASSVAGHCAREDGARQVPRNARPSPERIDRQIVKWLYFSVSIRAATR